MSVTLGLGFAAQGGLIRYRIPTAIFACAPAGPSSVHKTRNTYVAADCSVGEPGNYVTLDVCDCGNRIHPLCGAVQRVGVPCPT